MMIEKENWTALEYSSILKETQKALRLEMSGGNKEWFPKSNIMFDQGFVWVENWVLNSKIKKRYG